MLLTIRDDVARYRIEAPDNCEVKLNHRGCDYLVVPDPEEPGVPFWLYDEVLIEAARDGDFGLRLIWEVPLVGLN